MKYRHILKDAEHPFCAHCRLTIKTGQVGMYQDLGPQHPITNRRLWFHRACLVSAISNSPSDQDEQAFHDLRDRIATAGVAFPD